MTRATWSSEDRAWLDAHPGERLPCSPYCQCGGRRPWASGRRNTSTIPDPAAPTTEEIARVADRTVPYMRHRRAMRIALQENQAVLVAEGGRLATREGLLPATLMALATIHRIGTGRA